MLKKSHRILFLAALIFLSVIMMVSASGSRVLIVPIRGTINPAMADSVIEAIRKANGGGTRAVILDINTYGGLVDPAIRIRDEIQTSKIPIIAYINKRAWSAGALIAISCQSIVFAPGGSLGSAEPRPAEAKIIAALRSEFTACAEKNGRNPEIAAGMVDKEVKIEGLKSAGSILSLSAEQAKNNGYADYIAPDVMDLLTFYNIEGAEIETARINQDWLHSAAEAVRNPYVATTLITIGLLGLLIELVTFCSLAGGIGILSMVVFFSGHIILDPTKWWTAIIFGVGVIFLIAEIFFIPGHGITGAIGFAASFLGIFMVISNPAQAMTSLSISALVAAGIFAAILKFLPMSPVWNKFRLITKESTEEGYISSEKDKSLEGALGAAVTDLRPAGAALINGKRIDVTSSGGYIKKDSPLRVVRVEGIRVVVEEAEGSWQE